MTPFPQFIGGFEILGTLGQGGMGIVYCARDNALKRELAIKVQLGDWENNPKQLARFLREAQILAQINHPNVVQIYSVGEHEGAPFFAMELMDTSVGDAARLKSPGIAQVKRWMLEASRGLAAIHETGVVHRDIKPGNLLLSRATSVEEEHVKVADLGIASSGQLFGPALTRGGAILGTTGYLAPESFRIEHTLDGRADQYALGLVFFQLLARRAPYDDMGDGAMMAAIIHPRTPPDVRGFRPEVDAETAEVLMRMLRDDPGQRFQSTAELVKALAMVQAPIEARSSSPNDFARMPTELEARPRANARIASARPAMIVVIAAALTLSLLVAGIYLWRTKSPVAPAVATAPLSTTAAVDPLRQEAWAKYLLSRYRLETVAEKNDWTLDLVTQSAGVIDAELYDPDDSLIELSGRVESHQIEAIDGEEWETYQLKLLGPGDIVMDMRVSFSDESTTGKASLLYYGEKQHFEIKESVDL